MCYITSKDETIKIADRDIVVYKLLNRIGDMYISGYYGKFIYEQGQEYKTTIAKSVNMSSFDLQDMDYIHDNIPYNDRVSYGSGFHSCEFKERIQDGEWNDSQIHKFIIPKGAEYMYRDGLYISNRIRFVGSTQPTRNDFLTIK